MPLPGTPNPITTVIIDPMDTAIINPIDIGDIVDGDCPSCSIANDQPRWRYKGANASGLLPKQAALSSTQPWKIMSIARRDWASTQCLV